MPEDATAKRKRRVLAHYGKNLAGKLVRRSAFRECDYTPEGHLREFDTEDAVLSGCISHLIPRLAVYGPRGSSHVYSAFKCRSYAKEDPSSEEI